jgi:hypothetical protein
MAEQILDLGFGMLDWRSSFALRDSGVMQSSYALCGSGVMQWRKR